MSRRRARYTPEERTALRRARMKGNQFRKGIPHKPENKVRISASVKLAYAEGRHAPSFLKQFMREVAEGKRPSPWVQYERNDQMVKMYHVGFSFAYIARFWGVDESNCRKSIIKHLRRIAA